MVRSIFPKALWWAFAAAFLLRLVHVAALPDTYDADQSSTVFVMLARQLAGGGGFSFDAVTPTAFRLPAYPAALAVAISVAGGEGFGRVAWMLNLLFSAALLVVVFHVAKRLVGERWAIAAAALAGLNPELAELEFRAAAETLFALEFALAALCAIRILEAPERLGRWAACGAVIGLSLVTRSTLLVWPPLLATGLAWARPGPGVVRRAAALVACAYVLTAAWTIRNWTQFGRIVPFEDGMGWHMLWQGSTSVKGVQPDQNLPEPLRTYFFSYDPRIGPASKELAMRAISEDPLRYAGYCLKRIPVMWFGGAWAERTTGLVESVYAYAERGAWGSVAVKATFKILEFLVLVLAVFGAYSLRAEAAGLVVAFQVAYMNIHIFTMGLPRYIVPAFPLLAVLAVRGFLAVRERRS